MGDPLIRACLLTLKVLAYLSRDHPRQNPPLLDKTSGGKKIHDNFRAALKATYLPKHEQLGYT